MRMRYITKSKEELADMLTSDLFWESKLISIPTYSTRCSLFDPEQDDTAILERMGISYSEVLYEYRDYGFVDINLYDLLERVNKFCNPIEESVIRDNFNTLNVNILDAGPYDANNTAVKHFDNITKFIPWKEYMNWRIRNFVLCNRSSDKYSHAYANYLREICNQFNETTQFRI